MLVHVHVQQHDTLVALGALLNLRRFVLRSSRNLPDRDANMNLWDFISSTSSGGGSDDECKIDIDAISLLDNRGV